MQTKYLDARDLRWPWIAAATLVGVGALSVTSPLTVLGGAAAVVFVGLGVFRNPRHRVTGATIVSVGVGLMVPGLPTLLLQGVNSL
ncbi:hypothetical protein CJ179_33700 [Rhodococcus sp. ACS1]|uniref:Uncharacterized protein n=1 Tax=Rhodococcus koreensis TaxID=99653 RepID=A0A1H4IF58_9NOCA|nr:MULTISPECIES: hypothetical protein [Rhodococcus]PBC40199.1 hypothetical protein CJ179_33700 [Rhodococcus sp. ACS1]SEB31902.1 hypothetical protein SAMN04490239_0463 [Rhodococcus koreensis]